MCKFFTRLIGVFVCFSAYISGSTVDVSKMLHDVKTGVETVIRDHGPAALDLLTEETQLAQSGRPFNWCTYLNDPGKVGAWKVVDGDNLATETTGKRVALVVHGYNNGSLIAGFKNLAAQQLSNRDLLGTIVHGVTGLIGEDVQRKYEDLTYNWKQPMKETYGLGGLIHLARFLDNEVFLPGTQTKRYDLVIGYAYSSVARISDLGRNLADECRKVFKDAKEVNFFCHSMGGLVGRCALEKNGLLEESLPAAQAGQIPKYSKFISFCSPHSGVPGRIFDISPTQESFTTRDMLTGKNPLDKRSDFLVNLNDGDAPDAIASMADYYALAGNRYANLSSGSTKNGSDLPDNPASAGSLIQKAFEIFIPDIHTDGLIADYSALGMFRFPSADSREITNMSEWSILAKKSKSFKNRPHRQTRVLHLNHMTILGSADSLQPGHQKGDGCPQCLMTQTIKPWINRWPH